MNDLLNKALDQMIGPNNWSSLDTNRFASVSGYSPAVVAFDPPQRLVRQLAGGGYSNVRRFLMLPGFKAVRWLLPHERIRSTLAGFQIYTAFAPTARILKSLLDAMIRSGWHGWVGDKLLIATRGPLPLEKLVHEVTSEPRPVFSVSLGTPGRFRKLTMQVMRPDGEILGYIKLPLTDAAVARVRHEAEVLALLSETRDLQTHIPRVLYSGKWEGGHLLFQSPGPSRRRPIDFGAMHETFLQILRRNHSVDRPGRAIVAEVAARWQQLESLSDTRSRSLVNTALAQADHVLENVTVSCGITHGDFAPWNIRMHKSGIYVFDWEMARWDAPLCWDRLHFHVQLARLLKKKQNVRLSNHEDRACLVLYLVNSLCDSVEEGHATGDLTFDFRGQLLSEQLQWFPEQALAIT